MDLQPLDVLDSGPWFVVLNGHLRQVDRRHTTAAKVLTLDLGLDLGISLNPDRVEVANDPREPVGVNGVAWPGWTPVPLPFP